MARWGGDVVVSDELSKNVTGKGLGYFKVVRCNVAGWGTILRAGNSEIRFPINPLHLFFNWPSLYSRTLALVSTQRPTEMGTRDLPGSKGQPALEADNLTTICEPIVEKMWEPLCLTALWTSTACYKDSFTFTWANVTYYHSIFSSRK
jgi:hypothetical protein